VDAVRRREKALEQFAMTFQGADLHFGTNIFGSSLNSMD